MIFKKLIAFFQKLKICFYYDIKRQNSSIKKQDNSIKKENSNLDIKNILSLNNKETRKFLLKNESYINIDLPPYFNFEKLLNNMLIHLEKNSLIEICRMILPRTKKKLTRFESQNFENVNYKLLHNKNGKYDWRQFELVHPVLYVSLVKEITNEENWQTILNRFNEIEQESVINCMSLPIVSESNQSDKAKQILNWWEQIEQKSLELSLDFSYIYHTDITDCYGAIYTHSIPWALHSKKTAKENKNNKNLIGNIIDKHIRAMSYGQTNGIPQGSVLMDFIAEMVLSYSDKILSEKIKHLCRKDYEILRYRDDYRIFVNSPQIADEIIKNLTDVLIELGLKLNSQKTTSSSNVIEGSIKSDKMAWFSENKKQTTIQKRLLQIHKFSLEYPNSGTLVKELQNLLHILHQKRNLNKRENILVLISIIVDIAYLNPRTYSVSIAMISSLLRHLSIEEISRVVKKIMLKFDSIPNTGYMQIWLQRTIIKLEIFDIIFDENICNLVDGIQTELWNNEWLNEDVKNIFKDTSIIDRLNIETLDAEISENEVQLFGVYSS